eukprot:11216857-Lingulodinium_polyedra.AAC.1
MAPFAAALEHVARASACARGCCPQEAPRVRAQAGAMALNMLQVLTAARNKRAPLEASRRRVL